MIELILKLGTAGLPNPRQGCSVLLLLLMPDCRFSSENTYGVLHVGFQSLWSVLRTQR